MAKFAADVIMDAALNRIKNTVNQIAVCEGQPATRASAIAEKGSGGQMLAQVAASAGSFTGPGDGDSSGRKLTVNQQTGLEVSATGVGNHVCLLTASTIEVITTATSLNLTDGNSLTVNGFDYEIADVT